MKRPPIVVVLGHVDHGKTTLLDYIRRNCVKADSSKAVQFRPVAEREVGGITQSIGAYEIEHLSATSRQTQKITFIDTPGHEAFSAMRQRGARVAALGILVVAADDGIQNQAKEAFAILSQTKTPFVVAINKIDKSNADVAKTKNDLAQAGILLEGYGGNISWQGISAKTGEHINDLLDLLLLAGELENLEYDPTVPFQGFILESHLDKNRGPVATLIIKNGTLLTGKEIFSPTSSGKIKLMEDFLGQKIEKAVPSAPVRVLGFAVLPNIGEEFSEEPPAIPLSKPISSLEKTISSKKENQLNINLILKGDAAGSLEVLSQIIKNLPQEKTNLEIISGSVGEITDGDVKEAIAHKALLIGFRTKPNKPALNLAKAQNMKIIFSEIVYELIQEIEKEIQQSDKKIIAGDLEILAVFGKKEGTQQIIGGRVIAGEIQNSAILDIKRNGATIGKGKIINLQQNKEDAKKVTAGNECGLLVKSDIEIRIGDHLLSI